MVAVPLVVNCFQIVSLTYRSQPAQLFVDISYSCELLSDCIFDIPITTPIFNTLVSRRLWIAFRLYLWHTDHNSRLSFFISRAVVNCFQIVSLTYRSQLIATSQEPQYSCELLSDCIFDIPITTIAYKLPNDLRCELLSDCIFDIPITTVGQNVVDGWELWIAFRLYLWHTDHNNNHWHNL